MSQAECLIHSFVDGMPSVSQLDRDLGRFLSFKKKRSWVGEDLQPRLLAAIRNSEELLEGRSIDSMVVEKNGSVQVDGLLKDLVEHCAGHRLFSGWQNKKTKKDEKNNAGENEKEVAEHLPPPHESCELAKEGGDECMLKNILRSAHRIRDIHLGWHREAVSSRIRREGISGGEQPDGGDADVGGSRIGVLPGDSFKFNKTKINRICMNLYDHVRAIGRMPTRKDVDLMRKGNLASELVRLVGWCIDIKKRDLVVRAAVAQEMRLRVKFDLETKKFYWDREKKIFLKPDSNDKIKKNGGRREPARPLKSSQQMEGAVEDCIEEWQGKIDRCKEETYEPRSRASGFNEGFWSWLGEKADAPVLHGIESFLNGHKDGRAVESLDVPMSGTDVSIREVVLTSSGLIPFEAKHGGDLPVHCYEGNEFVDEKGSSESASEKGSPSDSEGGQESSQSQIEESQSDATCSESEAC